MRNQIFKEKSPRSCKKVFNQLVLGAKVRNRCPDRRKTFFLKQKIAFCPNLSTKSKNKNKIVALPPFGGLEMKLEKIKESKESFEKKKNMMLLFFVFFDDFVKT